MWKMMHLLNNTKKEWLTTKELFNVGVDCYSDTLIEFRDRGAVEKQHRGQVEEWRLTAGARAVLNSCTWHSDWIALPKLMSIVLECFV